jgi:CO/xanthine dehydrogenase FAD-binding subunit
MIAVTVPACADAMVYIKETARKGNDFAYGTIAARRERIVLGSLTTKPCILREPVEIVAARGLSDEAIEAAAVAARDELGALTNLYTPAAYKSSLARSLVREALLQLREAE